MSINYKAHNEDRMRRAESWLAHAEEIGLGDEGSFLAYWIAFNAAYGRLTGADESERDRFIDFAEQIASCDVQEVVKTALDANYAAVRTLMKNRYIYAPFWWSLRDPNEPDWRESFDKRNEQLWESWRGGYVDSMLREILSRIYILRNQIIHGGTTFGDESWGEKQLQSGKAVMSFLVPAILKVMDDSIKADPKTDIWGAVAYPRYKEHE